MKYPKFLNNNDLIGVTAMSAGVGRYNDSFDLSIKNLNTIKVTDTVEKEFSDLL